MSDTLPPTIAPSLSSQSRAPEFGPNPDPGSHPHLDRLNHLLNAVPDAVLCLDRDWRILFANAEARRTGRLTQADLDGKTLWQIYPQFLGTELEALYRKVMAAGVANHIEYFHAPFDLWVDIHVIPIEDGIALHYRDISSQKQAEARRDLSARQLEQVLEATTDAVFSLNRDWTFTFLNRQAISLLGDRNDLVGKNVWEEYPAAVDAEFYTSYRQTMQTRVASEFEAFYPSPLNLWFSVHCRPSEEGIVIFFRDITAERAAKQVLLDQQTTLSFVQQTARVATWELDLTTGEMTFGDGSYPVFGRPFSTIQTRQDFRNLVYPEDRPRVQARTTAAIETGAATAVDYRVTAPDGTVVWLEGRGVPVYNDQGLATHLRGMTTDITARKKAGAQLAASEERYRVLADLNPQAIWMGAADGSITYANQGFLDYIGKTLEGIQGLGWLEPFDPDDQQRVAAAWIESIATGTEYLIDARLLRARDRASRWWTLRGLPVRNESGIILHWLGVASDIHDSKTAAEELRQKQEETERQRAELETLYRTAPIGLALFDPVDFRYLRLNDRQAEIVGLPPEQILGKTFTAAAPISGLRELFEQVVAGKSIHDCLIEGELATRPGEHRFWNVNYSPVFAPDGTVQAISSASVEITHQKKSELALIQSEKLAAVGRLASSISHEINNPLEAITNLLFLAAMDETLPETIKTYIHMAQSELSRVSQIATQTLRFHRQAVRPTWVTAAELVNAVLNLYQGRLSNSGIHVEAKYASTSPILCFENDIRQVLNNLIANAIDAMRTGGQIFIRAHDVSTTTDDGTPAKGVRITIADTGHGMSPATRARIFEPFYTTKALNGTGLGLWISTGIVQHHNGRLTVRSSQHPLHHGTIFCLFLPCEDL